MKPFSVYLICVLLPATVVLPAAAGSPPAAGATIATVSKVISDVTRKEPTKDWQKATMGELLGTGDRVKTGDRSIAIIKFKDNSLVRVRSQSELAVTGTMKGAAFSKSVNLDRGGIGFSIAKQRSDEEFRFTSPTSVASIRGTGGQYLVAADGDTLTVLTGTVHLTNNNSSNAVEISEGNTGISHPDGTIFTRRSTESERRSAEDALLTGDQPMKLEFDLRDGQGKSKPLRIDFKQ
jgi:hypothetical protein